MLEILLVILAFLQSAEASDQYVRLVVNGEDGRKTSNLSCWDRKTDTFRSRVAKSPVISAKQTNNAAYVVVKAQVMRPETQSSASLCENVSQLFVRSGPRGKFKLAYEHKPGQAPVSAGGSGLRVVEWSHGGTELLAELTTWDYETDAGILTFPFIYKASQKRFEMLPVYEAVKKFFGKECEFDASTKRFHGPPLSSSRLIKLRKMNRMSKFSVFPLHNGSYSTCRRTPFGLFGLRNKFLGCA
jgi:hypothetical protein